MKRNVFEEQINVNSHIRTILIKNVTFSCDTKISLIVMYAVCRLLD